MSPSDWAALRFEAGQLFTPSTPISLAKLFAGRATQLGRMIDTISERGRHAILYGEPGVGKTSLAQIVPYVIPSKIRKVRFCRKPADPGDTFSSLWLKVFRDVKFYADINGGVREYNVAETYAAGVTPDDVVQELSYFSENDIPIVVLDEFNAVKDGYTSTLMANTIKALSDASVNVTVIIVGVADSVSELISAHESIIRCTEEIPMPRMNSSELREILDKRIPKLGMRIDGDAKWKIINLAKGLPSFAHNLGKFACFTAIDKKKLTITEKDVDDAIDSLLQSSQETFRSLYEVATRSNQPGNLFKEIITACAMAPTDESGYFAPVAVKKPLSSMLKRPVEVYTFQDHLREFIDEKRGPILQRIGQPRSYRFRFKNPAMQPYVIMKSIAEGILDESARSALSYPEQPDLFASEPEPPS